MYKQKNEQLNSLILINFNQIIGNTNFVRHTFYRYGNLNWGQHYSF